MSGENTGKSSNKSKKAVAVALASILLIGGVLLWNFSGKKDVTKSAGLGDLLASESERRNDAKGFIVSGDSEFFALQCTPAACYYNSTESHTVPLLVEVNQPDSVLNAMERFYDAYRPESIVLVGPADDHGYDVDRSMRSSCPKRTSLDLAATFWESSDGAILVEKSYNGYEEALWAAPLASYVNIPIIVTDEMDGDVRSVLKDLGVKYTIICGNVRGFGKMLDITGMESTHSITRAYMNEALGLVPEYVAMANPLDCDFPPVLDSFQKEYSGEVFHIGSTGAYAGLEEMSAGVDFEIEIPESFKNSIMRITLSYFPHEQDEVDGERIYVWVLWHNEDGEKEELNYFGTPAGYKSNNQEIVDFDFPVLNNTGKYTLHVEGRMTYEGVPIPHVSENPVAFEMSVRVDELATPVYPLMEKLSSLAPYLAAHRRGLVMAKGEYALHHVSQQSGSPSNEPSMTVEAMEVANERAIEVRNDLIRLLADIGGYDRNTILETPEKLVDMSDHFHDEPVNIGIISDTNMIPHYYHGGGTAPSHGIGQPGDVIYADIDIDIFDTNNDLGDGCVEPTVQDVELPIGRLCGWDAQDVSATLARTFFYYDIIDNIDSYSADSDGSWKNNAYAFLGSVIPVETMYGTLIDHVVNLYDQGGFVDVRHTSEEGSDIKLTSQFQEGSNYIIGGVHGNYYWYVPACRWEKTAGGSAYDVTNTRELAFGPSTFFLVSCITGRIDGLNPRNALAMTYVHGGVNAYVGATRSTLGWINPDLDFDMRFLEPEGAVLLSEYFLEELVNDETAGIALRNAKNSYLPTDLSSGAIKGESYIMFQHYILHGDPAFNPYEPANV